MHESKRMDLDVREAGAHGYVQKSQAARDLILAVERLLSGNTFFPPQLDAQPKEKTHEAAPGPEVVLRLGFCFA
jgi:DNA-binding NarL/FixJ family response regulator